MHNDSLMEVSENTFIPKLLMVSRIPGCRFFSVYLKFLGFGVLTVTETALQYLHTCHSMENTKTLEVITHFCASSHHFHDFNGSNYL